MVVRRCGEIVKQRGSTTAPRATITHHTPAATTTPNTAPRHSPQPEEVEQFGSPSIVLLHYTYLHLIIHLDYHPHLRFRDFCGNCLAKLHSKVKLI